jgi:hypothetical protein
VYYKNKNNKLNNTGKLGLEYANATMAFLLFKASWKNLTIERRTTILE